MTNRGIEQKPTHPAHATENPAFASQKTPIASSFPPTPKKPRKPPPFASSALNVWSAHVSLSITRRANHRQLSAIKPIQIAMTACMTTNPQTEVEVPFLATRRHPGYRVLEGSIVSRMMPVHSTSTADAAAAILTILRQNFGSKFMNGSSLSLEGISALPMKPPELRPRLN